MTIDDICYDCHDRHWCSFFCKISSYFGPKFGYLRIYVHFGVILTTTGLNSLVCTKIDKCRYIDFCKTDHLCRRMQDFEEPARVKVRPESLDSDQGSWRGSQGNLTGWWNCWLVSQKRRYVGRSTPFGILVKIHCGQSGRKYMPNITLPFYIW